MTLDNVTINGTGSSSYEWAGITCLGDATIILKDGTTNTVKGFYEDYPGIHVPVGSTITIQGGTSGTGKLIASSNGFGAGIGGGYIITSGSILIEGGIIEATGGTVTATGDENAAGIGGGWDSDNGTITIMGGTIIATGGKNAPGIGAGLSGSGGNITITNTVTKVTAYKGDGEYQSDCDCIGKSYIGSCGTVTIDGTMYYNGTQYRNNGYSYFRQNTIIYPPQP